MSHQVFTQVIRGSTEFVNWADRDLTAALSEHGEDLPVQFPETGYCLPMAYALLGLEVRKVGDMKPILEHCKELLPEIPTESLWLPYLGHGLDAGAATMLSQEIIVALRYAKAKAAGSNDGVVPQGWQGFLTDTWMRELGIQLVDGRMPGFAAILGPAPTTEIAENTVRELQKRGILTFLCANRDGKTMRDQMVEADVVKDDAPMDEWWNNYIVPVGPDTVDGIYVLNWAIRSALTFGGHKRGEARKCLDYTKARIHAFGITFGPIPDDWYALGAGAILMGFPVISDHTSTPEVRPTGVTVNEALVRELDHGQIVPTCILIRGVKVKVEEVDIPVSYAPAFEGERVRKDDMYVEFGGKKTNTCEFLTTAKIDEINDGEIDVVGPDFDSVEAGSAMPLAIRVWVAGRKMQDVYEGIFERQFHRWLNHATGLMHTGQRDQLWCRLSKKSFDAGFRAKHLGTIIHAKLHDEYGGIVDKVKATIYTDPAEVDRVREEAAEAYEERDNRIAGMKDENTDTYYTCTICQSYAPTHVCIITPERLGLCGAYNWLDGKAAYEINPTGPNQPIQKGKVLDERLGQWENVNEYVKRYSQGAVEKFSAYSMMEDPMTSCGCFECIVAVVPEANGVMVVNREYPGETPIGMPFSTLAGSVGGGAQTPGFLGVGRLWLTSSKFISADGGMARIVWLPKDLKEAVRDRMTARAKELGLPEDFVDRVCDETIATDSEGLLAHLSEKEHPALTMESMI